MKRAQAVRTVPMRRREPSPWAWRNDAEQLDLGRAGGLGDHVFLGLAAQRLKRQAPRRALIMHCDEAIIPLCERLWDRAEPLTGDKSFPAAAKPKHFGGGRNLLWTVEAAPDAYWTDRVTLFERFCGLPASTAPLALAPFNLDLGRRLLAGCSKPTLLLTTLQSNGQRNLPPATIRALLPVLQREYDVVACLPPRAPTPPSLTGAVILRTTLAEFMAVAGAVDRCLGVDTGGTYLAAAQGAPTVALYEHVAPWLRCERIPAITALYARGEVCRCLHHDWCTRPGYSREVGEPCKLDLSADLLLDLLRDAPGGCFDLRGAAVDRWTDFERVAAVAQPRTLYADNELRQVWELAMRTRNLPGCGVELGVYRGGSARVLASAFWGKCVHLFEAFGIPADQADKDSAHPGGDFAADEAEVRASLADLDNLTWHVGRFPDTWQDVGPIAFAHIDCDTEAGTAAALDRISPRLPQGGIILVDDYRWPNTPGVTRAVDAWRETAGRRFEVTVSEKKCVIGRR